MSDDFNSPSSSDSPKEKILLAEDDSSVRRFIEIILQRAGYEVFAAEDGLAAMKIAMEEDIDVIVADAIMPNLGGFDLCRILRQNSKYTKKLFVILSGLENKEENTIADSYLLKENNLKETLINTLSDLLGKPRSLAD